MGEIRKENLHQSLIEHLNGLGLTEEQVNEIVAAALVDINEKNADQDEAIAAAKAVADAAQTKTDEKLVTNDKTIVGAINELFQSANNGKELIASAIGEPVSADDTFQAMSNAINGLLSTFKTNMLNKGVTVDANDGFESLINKITTLSSVQYAEGSPLITGTILSSYKTYNVTLGFKPSTVFIKFGGRYKPYQSYNMGYDSKYVMCDKYNNNDSSSNSFTIVDVPVYIGSDGPYWYRETFNTYVNLTETGFSVSYKMTSTGTTWGSQGISSELQFTYYAIG